MKRFQSILCASLLTIALASTAFAKAGNITVSRTGNITVSSAGNISGVTGTGNTASISVDRFSFDLTNYLFLMMPSIW